MHKSPAGVCMHAANDLVLLARKQGPNKDNKRDKFRAVVLRAGKNLPAPLVRRFVHSGEG
jgi:hypothetical protein